MRTAVPSPGQSLLTAIAGLTAYRAGSPALVLELGCEPLAFAGAVALAARLADELRDAGGDPDAILTRAYLAASART
jgi:hypothetical protein